MNKHLYIGLGALVVLAGATACHAIDDRPEESDQTPLYRWEQDDQPSSGERGNMQISEINFAGSVTDDGVRDADDVFIEIQNKHPRPINVSGWHLTIEGDVERDYRIPHVEDPIKPNDYFVIAKKKDGAFKDVADVFIEDLELGTNRVYVGLRDYDLRLQESAGSPEEEVFAGGWDTVTVRSMERVQLIFGNRGENSRNWHAYSDTVGFDTIAEGYRKHTLASPGQANSADYSGSSTSGNFE